MANQEKVDGYIAQVEAWQSRTDELTVANQELRDQRELNRITIQSLEQALTNAEAKVRHLSALVHRLQIHISQGIEL